MHEMNKRWVWYDLVLVIGILSFSIGIGFENLRFGLFGLLFIQIWITKYTVIWLRDLSDCEDSDKT